MSVSRSKRRFLTSLKQAKYETKLKKLFLDSFLETTVKTVKLSIDIIKENESSIKYHEKCKVLI